MRIFAGVMWGIAMVLAAGVSWAEMMPIEPGTVRTYDSSNGAFQARVTYGELGVSLALWEGEQERWSASLMERPGVIAVSDNGAALAVTTFGWEDEGGSDGMVIYNAKGEAVKTISFAGEAPSSGGLKWVRVLEVSSDGGSIAVGQNGSEHCRATVYNAQTGLETWSQEAGYAECVSIRMAPGQGRTVLATRNDDLAMAFVLLDKDGKVIGNKVMEKNFTYDVPAYMKFRDDGAGVDVFDLSSGKFVPAGF